ESTAYPDDPHRELVENRAVADELVRSHRRERRDRIDEGDHPGLRKPGRHTDHVLFRDADVVEAVRKALAERLEHAESEVARQQGDAMVALRQLGERSDERVSHRDRAGAPTSDAASATS